MLRKILIYGIILGIIASLSWLIYSRQPGNKSATKTNINVNTNSNQTVKTTACDTIIATLVNPFPKRLTVLQPCVTAKGTVMNVRIRNDDNAYIFIQLDTADQYLLNDVNKQQQFGYIIAELVCYQNNSACSTATRKQVLPTVGQHISLTGRLVLDKKTGWNKISPLTNWSTL
ncbi:MAG: hypothetical protein WCW27_06720 [Patescibacteria group bacterium]|jgi:hypothetical protein